jgi:hypothetical protein
VPTVSVVDGEAGAQAWPTVRKHLKLARGPLQHLSVLLLRRWLCTQRGGARNRGQALRQSSRKLSKQSSGHVAEFVLLVLTLATLLVVPAAFVAALFVVCGCVVLTGVVGCVVLSWVCVYDICFFIIF